MKNPSFRKNLSWWLNSDLPPFRVIGDVDPEAKGHRQEVHESRPHGSDESGGFEMLPLRKTQIETETSGPLAQNQ